MSSSSKRKKESEQDDQAQAQKRSRTEADSLDKIANFKSSLDFSHLTSSKEITERFEKVATSLLQDLYLVVKNGDKLSRFEILELEFYLLKERCHEDPFTHGSEEQKIGGKWYFHRAPLRSDDASRSLTSRTLYRDGTRKGLDLTIGNLVTSPSKPADNDDLSTSTSAGSTSTTKGGNANHVETPSLLRGGALLRSIRRFSDKKVTSGPSLLVDQILELTKASSIADLVEGKWSGNTSAFEDSHNVALFLEPRNLPTTIFNKPPKVYRSPRIGLDLSHPGTAPVSTHPRVAFLPRPYRYFVYPNLLTTKGRPQTFLGILRFCTDTGNTLESAKLPAELARITGMKAVTVTKYLADYKLGLEQGKLDEFVGPKGKDISSFPGLYLKMMGTIDGLGKNKD